MNDLWATLWALVLPYPEREPYERQSSADLPFWSLLLGLAQFFGAFGWLFNDGQAFFAEQAARNAELFARNPQLFNHPGMPLAYMLSGILNVLLWLFQPTTWLGASVLLVGFGRLLTFTISREVSGEFFAWLYFSLRSLATRLSAPGRKLARYGPADREARWRDSEVPGEKELVVARHMPDWVDGATLEIGEGLFEVLGAREHQLEGELFVSWVYRLRPQGPERIIRRFIRVEIPFVDENHASPLEIPRQG